VPTGRRSRFLILKPLYTPRATSWWRRSSKGEVGAQERRCANDSECWTLYHLREAVLLRQALHRMELVSLSNGLVRSKYCKHVTHDAISLPLRVCMHSQWRESRSVSNHQHVAMR
jgi:hypothetical protein